MASPPPVIPIGDRSCNALLGENGSPLRETRLVWPAPLSFSTQLPRVFHGWSLNTVSPAGWFDQPPDAGGGGGSTVTVTLAVPLIPPLVAVSVVVPANRPVTTPVSEIPAIVGAFDVHVTVPFTTL